LKAIDWDAGIVDDADDDAESLEVSSQPAQKKRKRDNAPSTASNAHHNDDDDDGDDDNVAAKKSSSARSISRKRVDATSSARTRLAVDTASAGLPPKRAKVVDREDESNGNDQQHFVASEPGSISHRLRRSKLPSKNASQDQFN
jgi:hypothetical protein